MLDTSTAYQVPDAWDDHDQKVRAYVYSRRVLALAQMVFGLGFLMFWTTDHRFVVCEITMSQMISIRYVLYLAYFTAIAACWKLVATPLDIISYFVEKKFGQTKQQWKDWVLDNVKATFLSYVFLMVTISLLFICISIFDYNDWWIAAYIMIFGLFILLGKLAPVYILPLFFSLKPLNEGPLRQRLLKLCNQLKVNVSEIYTLGLGAKTEKGNAAIVGFGSTKRIMIGDTLQKNCTEDEVEAVFAHELGHHVNHDIWKGVTFSALSGLFSFYMAHWLSLSVLFLAFGIDITRASGMLSFLALVSLAQIPVRLVRCALSRHWEVKADDFASRYLDLGTPLANALERLTIQNYSFFRPNVWIELFTFTHPAPWRRILRLKGIA